MRRQWEDFWEKDAPQDFMRLDYQFTHPARKKVYEIAKGWGDSVLDVGCGTGIDYKGFIEKGMQYVGVDITPKFVARFKELHPEADVRCHSSLNLPFEDDSFPVVYSGGMIQHMHPKDYPDAIREMWRICQKGLILTTSKQFTRKLDVIQKVRGGKVYDNHYGMPLFQAVLRSLPRFKDLRFHVNFGEIHQGEPYTVVEIKKKAPI
jgi:ubiquinone/menaquinone biosynthesis C-methylase UbiE